MTFPLLNGEPWVEDALCAQVDPEMFYPEKGDDPGQLNRAKSICKMCGVSAKKFGGTGECLEYALKNGERFGVWGGYTERERRKLKTRRLLRGNGAA